MRKLFIRFLWIALVLIVGISLMAFVAIWKGWVGYMPEMADIMNPLDRSATQVYSSDGIVMGTWSANHENRIIIPYSKLSPHLVHALVSTEDERFYDHSGIDFVALGRAVVKRGIFRQESAGGGSTITQQLAKQLYSRSRWSGSSPSSLSATSPRRRL